MQYYYPPINFFKNIIHHKKYIGQHMCSVCNIEVSTQIQLLNEFHSVGILTCFQDCCNEAAELTVKSIYEKYPIYNLSLDLSDLKWPYGNKHEINLKFSTKMNESFELFLNNESVYTSMHSFLCECTGLAYWINDKMYIVIINLERGFPALCFAEIKNLFESNNIDPKLLSLPDNVKEYLGIPLN